MAGVPVSRANGVAATPGDRAETYLPLLKYTESIIQFALHADRLIGKGIFLSGQDALDHPIDFRKARRASQDLIIRLYH